MDVYSVNGVLLHHLVSNGAGSALDEPWGLAIAPGWWARWCWSRRTRPPPARPTASGTASTHRRVMAWPGAGVGDAGIGDSLAVCLSGDVPSPVPEPINKPGGDWRSLVMETVLTAILVSAILDTAATGARSIGHNAAIAVCATVTLLGLFASPISGASMNPACTAGPDIVSTDFTGWWVYIIGPIVGAAIAVVIIAATRGRHLKRVRKSQVKLCL